MFVILIIIFCWGGGAEKKTLEIGYNHQSSILRKGEEKKKTSLSDESAFNTASYFPHWKTTWLFPL